MDGEEFLNMPQAAERRLLPSAPSGKLSKTRKSHLILVPSELLLEQWREEISTTLADQQPQLLLCGGGHLRWRNESLLGPWSRTGTRPRIILATMQTAASDEFRAMIRQGKHLFMVADEVHRLGSVEHLKLLDLETGPRLGLSATPRRAGDPSGTRAIFEYFNGCSSTTIHPKRRNRVKCAHAISVLCAPGRIVP